MSADELARERQLWRLNKEGLIVEAAERSPGGIITRDVASELVARWFEQHPEEQKPPKPRGEPRKRARKRRQGAGESETVKLERLRARLLRDALRDDVEAEPPPVTIVLLPAKEPGDDAA